MSKTQKQAEKALTDADKFPTESCREKIARRYGLDAVALSGPCEGMPLADCVCDQLSERWDRISGRFAGNKDKVVQLAMKVAESWMSDDDNTGECAKDLESKGFSKEAANGIANYLKAYHIKSAMDDEMDSMMDDMDKEEEDEKDLDSLGDGDDDGDEGGEDEGGEESENPFADKGDEGGEDEGGEEGGLDMALDEGGEVEPGELEPGSEAGMISIELPVEVVEELLTAFEGYEHEVTNLDSDPGLEIVEMDEGGIPGEPAAMDEGLPGGMETGEFVTGNETEMAAGPAACPACSGGGKGMEMEQGMGGGAPMGGGAGAPMMASPGRPETERGMMGGMGGGMMGMASNKDNTKEAAMALRAGKIKLAQNILRIGPEMSINNTDQSPGGKDLGKAKNKGVEDPKALEDGNVKPEAYTAGDSKFQDGSTMGSENKFDAHKVSKDEVSGGKSSLMGQDESFPEGKPEVPAGSAGIGGEEWSGGDLSTKGTVIATITPKGIKCEMAGQKPLLAKLEIKEASEALISAIQSVKFDGDLRKFAEEVGKVAKKTMEDGVCKTDTSKLEAENFTNDGEKKPEDGGAAVYYGKKGSGSKDGEEETKTNTSKLESEKFTNDAEKKADDDTKKAAAEKETKTAGDKKVEDPKALEDGNVKPEGYTAGDSKFKDGTTMGNESKFDPHEVTKDEVSGGDSSLLGQDESFPKDGPKVPAGGGQMGQEEWDGGDVSTKGTVIAETEGQEQNRKSASELENEFKVREARLKAASVLAADMLKNGEINENEYQETFERLSGLPVTAIQTIATSIRKQRAKAEANKKRTAGMEKAASAGWTTPVVSSLEREEKPLSQKLSELFSSNELFDANNWDENGRKRNF